MSKLFWYLPHGNRMGKHCQLIKIPYFGFWIDPRGTPTLTGRNGDKDPSWRLPEFFHALPFHQIHKVSFISEVLHGLLVYFIKGSRHVLHTHTSYLPLVSILDPGIIHLNHGCCCAVMSPDPMVIWMKKSIFGHILHYLHEHNPLNNLTQDTQNSNRPVVLWWQWVIFF